MPSLRGPKVTKMGYVTPLSKGRIIKSNYTGKYAGTSLRHIMLVESTGKMTEFAKPGDSGSLVVQVDQNGTVETAIGIIHKRWENWVDSSDNEHDVTVVLPLKNCFDAVEKELGIKLELCGKWQGCHIEPFTW